MSINPVSLETVLRQLAELRFEVVGVSKSRRLPFRIIDRLESRQVGQAATEADINRFRDSLIADYVKVQYHALTTVENGVPETPDGSGVSSVLRQAHALRG
jgi:hypothetical protein